MRIVLIILSLYLCTLPAHATHIERELTQLTELGVAPLACTSPPPPRNESAHCQDMFTWGCQQKAPVDGTETSLDLSDRTAKIVERNTVNFRRELIQEAARDAALKAELLKLYAPYNGCEQDSTECLTKAAEDHAAAFFAKNSRPQNTGGPFDQVLASTYSDKLESLGAKHLRVTNDSLREPQLESELRDSIFPGIRDLMIAQVTQSVRDPQEAAKIKDKLTRVEFAGIDCQNNLLASYGQRAAYYSEEDPTHPKFYYCAGFLKDSTSKFRIAYIMAHELAHSFDPCKMRADQKTFEGRDVLDRRYAMPDVLSCLRSPDSVAADWDEKKFSGKDEGFPSNMLYCVGDQASESMADWTAAQVLPRFLEKTYPYLTSEQTKQGYANIIQSLDCEEKPPGLTMPGEGVPVSPHPRGRSRINKILMANPELRTQVGCAPNPGKPVYCQSGMDEKIYSPAPKKNPTDFPFSGGASFGNLSSQPTLDSGCFH